MTFLQTIFLAPRIAFGALALALAAPVFGDYPLDDDKKTYSYAVGTKIAFQIKQQFRGDEVDLSALAAGLNDVLSGKDAQLNAEEVDAAIEKRQALAQQAALEAAAQARRDGDAYRAEYKKKSGVQTTASGLLYRVLRAGDGKKPSADDSVTVHYEGRLIDGKVFDSSIKRGSPATFSLGGVIAGWTEVLQLMQVGGKWEVVIPPELAYGERGVGENIGANATLIFEIELLEIK